MRMFNYEDSYITETDEEVIERIYSETGLKFIYKGIHNTYNTYECKVNKLTYTLQFIYVDEGNKVLFIDIGSSKHGFPLPVRSGIDLDGKIQALRDFYDWQISSKEPVHTLKTSNSAYACPICNNQVTKIVSDIRGIPRVQRLNKCKCGQSINWLSV